MDRATQGEVLGVLHYKEFYTPWTEVGQSASRSKTRGARPRRNRDRWVLPERGGAVGLARLIIGPSSSCLDVADG